MENENLCPSVSVATKTFAISRSRNTKKEEIIFVLQSRRRRYYYTCASKFFFCIFFSQNVNYFMRNCLKY